MSRLGTGVRLMNAQERLDYLLETVHTPTGRQLQVADLIATVGVEGCGLVLGTLQAASQANPVLAAAYQALVTVGISLSDDLRQGMIDQLSAAGKWPDELRDAVKALGVTKHARWQTEGYASEPTLEQIQAEIGAAAFKESKNAKLQVAASRYNAYVDAVYRWDGSGDEPVL